MSDDNFEYAIKKDVRNNSIVREVDSDRHREMFRTVVVGVFLVSVVLFSAWQHFEQLRYGYRLEQAQRERAAESALNGHLRLEVETLSAPERIERLASERLGMVAPEPGDAVIVERVAPAPLPSVVAQR
jgi:cell division protein FtsL